MNKSITEYHGLSKLIHWVSALIVIALFISGWWMVDLDYYSTWYKDAPHYHKSVGLILFALLFLRIFWLLYVGKPAPIAEHSRFIQWLTKAGHFMLYLLILSVAVSGYLISTADGRPVEFFSWFSVPSLGELFPEQEDIAGLFHWYLACTLIIFAALHAIAALKHHFLDKDPTLSRMLGKCPLNSASIKKE